VRISSNYLRAIPEFFVVGICTFVFVLSTVGILVSVLGSHSAGNCDFVEYWASGHLLIHHSNPYAADAILELERSAGFPQDLPVLIMWNPPSALLAVLPLGYFNSTVGHWMWLMLLLGSLVTSVRMVWIIHDRPRGWLNVLGYTFGPAFACFLPGQTSLFLLLGLALFLFLYRSRPFLAGASLWLCMLKPHLFLPFGLVLIIWAIRTRKYRVLAGAVSALVVSASVVQLLDPLVWPHYLQMARNVHLGDSNIPCLSLTLRSLVRPHTIWIQYAPAVLGCLWAVDYFRRHRNIWDWMEHGSPLVLVSVLVAPYTWYVDQAVLIPALLHAAYLTRSRYLLALLPLISAILEIGNLIGKGPLHSFHFLWTAPAWLIWYLCAVSKRAPEKRCDPITVDDSVAAGALVN